jgi:erythritol kinase (D-erythritol 1-phosphate-forming)
MATLAIDAGTTLIKAVVISDSGIEVAISSRETTVSSPHPAWSEQDMKQVWESVEAACIDVLGESAESITQIAVTAQGDGAWIIDSEGAPLRPAILWNDGRAAAEIAAFVEAGKDREAWSTNGSLTSLGLPNAIMMWLAANEPDTLNSAHAVLTCGGWIIHQLTGIVAQDLSEACAPWIDIATRKISSDLLGLYGLSEYGHLIPPVLETPCLVLSDTIAAHWGLPATTPVVVAPYDIVATATGSGAVVPGDAFAILGTTICPGTVATGPQLDGVRTGLNLLGLGGGFTLRAFPTVTGANTLTWLAELVGASSVEELVELADTAPAGSNGVLWLPYLSTSGERAPFFDPEATGLLFGITQAHRSADIARALLESLSYIIRESLDASGTAPTSLALSGGGAHSRLWCQIIADVTGIPTTRTQDSQVGAKGAHVYASVATGAFSSFPDAVAALVHPGETFTPSAEDFDLHSRRFELFCDLRGAASTLWHRAKVGAADE